MSNLASRWLAAACVLCAASPTFADITYDSISVFNGPRTQGFQTLDLQADDITLDASADLTVTRIELLTRLRSMSHISEFNGTMTLRLYAGGGFMPGALITEASQPLVVARGTDLLTSFDLTNVVLPSRRFFVGWFFTMNGQFDLFNDMWVRQNSAAPSVGSSTINYFATRLGPPQWSAMNLGGSNYAVRVTTLPAPSGTAALAVGLTCLSHRRRAARR